MGCDARWTYHLALCFALEVRGLFAARGQFALGHFGVFGHDGRRTSIEGRGRRRFGDTTRIREEEGGAESEVSVAIMYTMVVSR